MSTKVVSEYSGAVFNLPWIVARDEGLFAREGIDLSFSRNAYPRPATAPLFDHTLIESFSGHQFEDGGVDVYRACEWGQIRRAYDSRRGGQIVGKRAAVAVMGIYARAESGIAHPQDLRGKTVAVNFHHGSHYAAIQMLEGFLEQHEIRVVHIGGPRERYEAVVDGVADAAALMEPWISLAEKQGLFKIIETHYVGSDMAAANLSAETFEAINRAVREAVQRINADKAKYAHHLLEDLPEEYRGQLTVDDLYLPRLRFIEPAPYPEEQFEKTYNWMVRWNLIGPDSTFDQLVDNRIAVA